MESYLFQKYQQQLNFQSPCPSTCPPFLSTKSIARLCISRTARLIKSGCCGKALNVSTIRWRNTSIFWGEVENNLSLRYPHRTKSHGVKSGERGGHSTSWPKPMTRLFPNTLLSRFLISIRRWAGAPSCAHQRPRNISTQCWFLKCTIICGKANSFSNWR